MQAERRAEILAELQKIKDNAKKLIRGQTEILNRVKLLKMCDSCINRITNENK